MKYSSIHKMLVVIIAVMMILQTVYIKESSTLNLKDSSRRPVIVSNINDYISTVILEANRKPGSNLIIEPTAIWKFLKELLIYLFSATVFILHPFLIINIKEFILKLLSDQFHGSKYKGTAILS